MGFEDKLKNLEEKAEKAAAEHPDQVKKGVGMVEKFVAEQMGGQVGDQTGQGGQSDDDAFDGAGSEDDGSGESF